MNCFTYDGKMLSKNRFSANPKLVAGFENMNDLNEIKQHLKKHDSQIDDSKINKLFNFL